MTPGYGQSGLTTNQTELSDMDYADTPLHFTIQYYLNVAGIPIIVILGTVGNLLSFFMFIKKPLKFQPASVYLAFLNLSDTGMLLSLLVAWLGWLGHDVYDRQGICQMVSYASYVFGFLSVWTIISFTVERYIVVFHPLKRHVLCTQKHALWVIVCLSLFALCFYSYVFWMSSVRLANNGLPTCLPKQRFMRTVELLSTFDTIITLIVPSITIVLLNSCIFFKISSLFRKRGGSLNPNLVTDIDGSFRRGSTSGTRRSRRQDSVQISIRLTERGSGVVMTDTQTHKKLEQNPPVQDECSTWCPQSHCERLKPCISCKRNQPEEQQSLEAETQADNHRCLKSTPQTASIAYKSRTNSPNLPRSVRFSVSSRPRHSSQIRVTRVLLLISTIFLVLNLPSHAFRIFAFVEPQSESNQNLKIWLHELCQLLYYTNFAANFFLYICLSKTFRKAIRHETADLYKRCVCRSRGNSYFLS